MKKLKLLTILSSFLLLAGCRNVNSANNNSGNGSNNPSNQPSVTSQNANPSEAHTSTTSRQEPDDSSIGGRGFFHSDEYGVRTSILFYLDDECEMNGDTTTGGRYEYQGRYSQNGNNITIRFTKCYYDSLLSPGKTVSYTATLSGNQLFLEMDARTITMEEYFWDF